MSASSADTRPLFIALTGGIASGKTAVARLFAELGVPVLDTDQIARDVVEPGTPGLAQLVAEADVDAAAADALVELRRRGERHVAAVAAAGDHHPRGVEVGTGADPVEQRADVAY